MTSSPTQSAADVETSGESQSWEVLQVWPTKEAQDVQLDTLLSLLNFPASQKVQVVAAVALRPQRQHFCARTL